MKKLKLIILTSKNSWLYRNKRKSIINELKKFSSEIKLISNFKKIKKNNDCLIIGSYYKIIPKKFLSLSKFNLLVHESDLPKGRGFSPLYWQILKGSQNITTTILEANENIDEGNYYIKKKFYYPKEIFFDEIKQRQFQNAIYLVKRVLKKIILGKKIKNFKQFGKPTYFRRRDIKDSELNVKSSLKKQINLLRIIDNKIYPAFFKYKGKKIYLNIKILNEKKNKNK